ncbi:plasmid mobilization relaxosome protein MobC [Anaerobutyricum hallii]|uniref:plasmid mobilization protein n=1 Tax=Anaerobutyricum hallii TaxID=39488 RepID=UPI002ED42EE3
MRKRRIDIRLSEKEYQLLLSKAGNDLETKTKKGDKANTSAYIRKCIFLQEDRPVRLEKELKNLSYQVRKIGVNINQVVAKINAGYGNQIDIYNLEKALEQIKHEMKTLNEKVEDYGDH